MNKTYTFIAACVIILCACNKKPDTKPSPPPTNPAAIALTLDIDHPGNAIPPDFQGLSFENWLLSRNPQFLDGNNAALVKLLKYLGSGIIRMGGNSSDETDWTDDGFNPNSHFDILTKTHIDKLADLSAKTNWKVIFGLNLGHNNIAASIDEAQYLNAKLGANLFALQIGNEPDYYKLGYRDKSYTVQDFEKEWLVNYQAIKAQLPGVPFAGPDVSDNLQWANTFALDNGKNVNLLDAHYYVDGPATDSAIKIKTILNADDDLDSYLNNVVAAASQARLGFRITEANSIWGGGKAGVSDTFASSLWALDMMWTIAEKNGQGVNFHGGDGLLYSPFTGANGVWTANPEYYAMLAFQYGAAGGTMIPLTTSNSSYNCNAFACVKADNTCVVTLINKEQEQDINFTIQPGKTVSNITVARLSGPSLTSKTGITFAGSIVGPDGTFMPGNAEQITINKNSFVVKVPRGSAAVITIY